MSIANLLAQSNLALSTQIVLADVTDYDPAVNLGARTHQLDLTGLVAGAYRQGAKIDFGELFYQPWEVTAAIEPASAPTAGGLISIFLGFSQDAAAGDGNPGLLTGADGAYVGYGAAAGDADEMAAQLVTLGSRPFSADTDVQVMHFGVFVPRARYACPLVKNGLSVNLAADAVEMAIRFTPVSQNAALPSPVWRL